MKKIGPTDFKAEVEKLHAAGKLPDLDTLLSVVADTRKEYRPQILKAREEDEDNGKT